MVVGLASPYARLGMCLARGMFLLEFLAIASHWVNQDRVYTVYRPCNRFTGCTRPYKIDSSCKRLQGL